MRLRAERFVGLRQAKRLATTALRRKRLKALRHAETAARVSDRVQARQAARQDLSERIKADQALGLEWRRNSEPHYREACRRKRG